MAHLFQRLVSDPDECTAVCSTLRSALQDHPQCEDGALARFKTGNAFLIRLLIQGNITDNHLSEIIQSHAFDPVQDFPEATPRDFHGILCKDLSDPSDIVYLGSWRKTHFWRHTGWLPPNTDAVISELEDTSNPNILWIQVAKFDTRLRNLVVFLELTKGLVHGALQDIRDSENDWIAVFAPYVNSNERDGIWNWAATKQCMDPSCRMIIFSRDPVFLHSQPPNSIFASHLFWKCTDPDPTSAVLHANVGSSKH